jgi:hypothetical protein
VERVAIHKDRSSSSSRYQHIFNKGNGSYNDIGQIISSQVSSALGTSVGLPLVCQTTNCEDVWVSKQFVVDDEYISMFDKWKMTRLLIQRRTPRF